MWEGLLSRLRGRARGESIDYTQRVSASADRLPEFQNAVALVDRNDQWDALKKRLDQLPKAGRDGVALTVILPGGPQDCLTLFESRLHLFDLPALGGRPFRLNALLHPSLDEAFQDKRPGDEIAQMIIESLESQRSSILRDRVALAYLSIDMQHWDGGRAMIEPLIEKLRQFKLADGVRLIFLLFLVGLEHERRQDCEMNKFAERLRKNRPEDASVLVLNAARLITSIDIHRWASELARRTKRDAIEDELRTLDTLVFQAQPLDKIRAKLEAHIKKIEHGR